MIAVPLSDEQADRIEAGEQPGAVGVIHVVWERIRPEPMPVEVIGELLPVPVTFTRPCPSCTDNYNLAAGDCDTCDDGRVPVTVPCQRCDGNGVLPRPDMKMSCPDCADYRRSRWAEEHGGHPYMPGVQIAQAPVVHVIPAADVVWDDDVWHHHGQAWWGEDGYEEGARRPSTLAWWIDTNERWWVGDAPWVLMVKWNR